MATSTARKSRKDLTPEEKAARKAERQATQERTLRVSSLRNAELAIARARQALTSGDAEEHAKWLTLAKQGIEAYDALNASVGVNGTSPVE